MDNGMGNGETSSARMIKKRNIVSCVLLSIVTIGIYGIYWFIQMTDDSNALAPKNATTSGGKAFLLTIVTVGIYGIYWGYKLGLKVDEMNNTQGSNGIVYLLLSLFGLSIIAECMAQSEINKRANC